MLSKKHYPINVSPFATNVLDLVDRDDLVTPENVKVYIRQGMNGEFIIKVDGKPTWITGDNVGASYILNMVNVGVMEPC